MASREFFHFSSAGSQHTMAEMRQSGELCDFTIKVGNECITAHRVVLASAIPYFRIMFRSNMEENKKKEITMKEADPDVMKCLIDFAYNNELSISVEKLPLLLQLSAYLLLDDVKDACLHHFCQRMDSNSVLAIRECAHMYNNEDVMKKADFYIRQNFEEVATSEEFLDLPFLSLKELIRKDDLNVVSEKTVFESVMTWVKACEEERSVTLPELLRHVRIHLLSLEYLTSRVSSDEIIRSSPPCKDFVEKAKIHHQLLGKEVFVPSNFQSQERYFEEGHHLKCAKLMGYGMYCACRYPSGEVRVKYYDHINDRWATLGSIEHIFPFYMACTEDKIIFITKSMAHILHLEKRKQSVYRISGRIPFCAGVVYSNNQIYFFGGGSASSNTVSVLDIENFTCREIGTISTSRKYPGVVSTQDDVYIIGGSGDDVSLSSVEKYSLATGQSSNISPMLTRRTGPGCAIINGRISVCGGDTESGPTESAEVYDIMVGKWSCISGMCSPKMSLSLVPYANKLYSMAIKPQAGNRFSLEAYRPTDDEWHCEGSVSFRSLPANKGTSCALVVTNTAARF